MGVLDSLFVKLGYDVDQEKVNNFNEGVERTARGMKNVVLSAIGAATAIGLFSKKMASIQNIQTQLAKNLNLPVGIAQAWQDAANDMGIDSSKAVSALTKINTVIENLKVGVQPSGEFLRGLADLNLQLGDIADLRADQALIKMSKGLSKLTPKVRGGVASLLGLRDELNLLGAPDLGKRIADNIDSIDTQNLTELAEQWANFTQQIRKTSTVLANEFAGPVGNAIDAITKKIKDLIKFIKNPQKLILDPINKAAINAGKKAIKVRDNMLSTDRQQIGALLESPFAQDAFKFLNDNFGSQIPTLSPEFTGASNANGATTNTINNNVKVDIITDNPVAAGREVEKAIENSNRKALTNLETLQVN